MQYMKKFLILFLVLIGGLRVFCAEEILRIKDINFDNSGSIIYMSATGVESSFDFAMKGTKLENPDRIFFDINNAILTIPANSWNFKNSPITQIKLSQFSTNPHVVRMVIYCESGFNPDKIKVLRSNNNIILKLGNEAQIAKSNYLLPIYREQTKSWYDYYEKLSFTAAGKPDASKTPASGTVQSDNPMLSQIQKSLGVNDSYLSAQSPEVQAEPEKKLKSSYYLNNIDVKNGNILVQGVGNVALERPIYLNSPSRVVFDLPNTVVRQDLRNKEFKISESETLKVGQFEQSKARIVITTKDVDKYQAIYSFDLQSLLIANEDRLSDVKLFEKPVGLIAVKATTSQDCIDILDLGFSAPIIHSIKRDNNKLELNLYNVTNFDIETFKKVLKPTGISCLRVDNLPNCGTKIVLSIKKTCIVDYYETLEGRVVKLKMQNDKKAVPNNLSAATVVLDAGHGGNDTGAFQAGIAEKDITLDVSKRVAAILINKGINVEMTRWQDKNPTLQERVEFSDSKKTSVFVSIHVNSSVKPEIVGIETHYWQDSGYDVAKIIQKSMCDNINSCNRGLFKSKFYVINHTKAPAVLVEIGYLSNANERNEMLNEQRKQQTAQAIADGIINYLLIK